MPAGVIIALLLAGLSPLGTFAQETLWEKHSKAGLEAYQEGRYAEAMGWYLEALKEAEKFGKQDPRVGVSLNNLADLYNIQAKYIEAEPLYLRSLTLLEETFGPEHPIVDATLNNLALLYRAQDNYGEAEPLYLRSLELREKVLGPEHPNLAKTLENYAALLRKLDRNEEADQLEERARAIRGKER